MLTHSRFMSAVVGLIGLLVASAAPAQTFSNTTPIGIPTLGRANLYPSVITLSGAPGMTFQETAAASRGDGPSKSTTCRLRKPSAASSHIKVAC
jgi:hypothetical protein